MDGTRDCWLIANAASGSNSEAALEAVSAALTRAGYQVARRSVLPDDELPSRAEVEVSGIGLMVTYTGDGTLRSILRGLEGWGGAVLVLPGGTTNLLSKALHGDRLAEDIVADLPDMQATRRKCIRSEAGMAAIEVVAGPGAKWSDVRENLREGDVAAVASTTVTAAQASTGESLVVLRDPATGRPEGYSGVRLTPFADGMEIEGYGAQTPGEYLQQGVALLRRDFRLGPHDELGRHRRVVCESLDGSPIELMLDGERSTGKPAIAFLLAELDLDLLSVG